MLTRIGRKLVKGATAEIQENPPDILNQDRWMDLLETGLTMSFLLITICGVFRGSSKQPVTVVVNNYISKG